MAKSCRCSHYLGTDYRPHLTDQQAQLAVQQNRLLASVALFQDLGGGFQASALPTAGAIQAQLPFAP